MHERGVEFGFITNRLGMMGALAEEANKIDGEVVFYARGGKYDDRTNVALTFSAEQDERGVTHLVGDSRSYTIADLRQKVFIIINNCEREKFFFGGVATPRIMLLLVG